MASLFTAYIEITHNDSPGDTPLGTVFDPFEIGYRF